MMQISSEKVPIDQKKLESIGVTLRTTSRTSSQSSEDEEKRFEEVDSDTLDDSDD